MTGWATQVKFVGGPAMIIAPSVTKAMLVLMMTQKIHCAATIGIAVLKRYDGDRFRLVLSTQRYRFPRPSGIDCFPSSVCCIATIQKKKKRSKRILVVSGVRVQDMIRVRDSGFCCCV